MDERSLIDYRVVKTDVDYYVQMKTTKGWHTLSVVLDRHTHYHFLQYRNFGSLKEFLKWWKSADSILILNVNRWLPSKGMNPYTVVTTKSKIENEYPEALI